MNLFCQMLSHTKSYTYILNHTKKQVIILTTGDKLFSMESILTYKGSTTNELQKFTGLLNNKTIIVHC